MQAIRSAFSKLVRRAAAGSRQARERFPAGYRPGGAGALLLAYSGAALLPLLLAALFGEPADYFDERLAAAFGLLALSTLLLQAVLSRRLAIMVGRVGPTRLLAFRRFAGGVILACIGLHVLALVLGDLLTEPGRAIGRLVTLATAPGLVTGSLAALLVAGSILADSFRHRLPIPDLACRIGQVGVGALAAALAIGHALERGTYADLGPVAAVVLLLAAAAVLALYLGFSAPPPRLRLQIRSARRAGPGMTEILAEPVGGTLSFHPGQSVWIEADGSVPADTRAFLASAPQDLPVVRLLLADESAADSFEPDRTVTVLGPIGRSAEARRSGRGVFVFAAGIGIGPALSLLRQSIFQRDERPIRLVYVAERWDDLVFRSEIEALARHLDLRFTFLVRAEGDASGPQLDPAAIAAAVRDLPAGRTNAMLWGSAAEVNMVAAALRASGLPPARVFADAADEPASSGPLGPVAAAVIAAAGVLFALRS